MGLTSAFAQGNGTVLLALLIGITLLAFAIVTTVFQITVRPEREAMRAVVAPEVAAGVLTPDEAAALSGGWRQRRRYRAGAGGGAVRGGGGPAERRRRRHRLEAAHDLADQLAASGGRETDRVLFTRAELARYAAR